MINEQQLWSTPLCVKSSIAVIHEQGELGQDLSTDDIARSGSEHSRSDGSMKGEIMNLNSIQSTQLLLTDPAEFYGC